ncbi:uncharacterized protein LOC142983851 [Anticarsia gemmatalis]|uniref:uncharacterized protein LOC142983851 n=1 Tax=Anticarsia gemmatalis TaxID=129554 RepID=UPI003F75AC20
MKWVALLAVTCGIAYAAAEDCECYNKVDREATWEYLTSLSQQMDSASDKEAYSVLPSVLSPLAGCECHKISERTILPEVEEKPQVPVVDYRPPQASRPNTRCPRGQVLVGLLCVPEDYSYDE